MKFLAVIPARANSKSIKKKKENLPQKEILEFCKYLNISKSEFFKVAGRFRNRKIWHYSNNTWKIKNFIIKDWKW